MDKKELETLLNTVKDMIMVVSDSLNKELMILEAMLLALYTKLGVSTEDYEACKQFMAAQVEKTIEKTKEKENK